MPVAIKLIERSFSLATYTFRVLLQPLKAFVPTDLIVLGIITVVRLVHPPKAHSLIVLTPFLSVTVFKLVHWENALYSITSTLPGTVIAAKFPHSKKAK